MQRRYAIAFTRFYMILMALCIVSLEIFARPLSPDEALSALRRCAPLKAAVIGDARMELAHTVCGGISGRPAVYVFNRAGCPGFCILAADDDTGDILLGYSDSSTFVSDAMPPGMQWLLEAYADRLSDPLRREIPRIEHSAIGPLVSTKWAQEAPYNSMCPIVSGSRAVAGCVAIAMAQTMKVHRWPAAGTGSCSYSYIFGDESVSVSADFAGHEYYWNDMLDTYAGVSTEWQRDAVALLAADCGAACNTEYSASSSSTSLNAGRGMIAHFGYDKSLRYLSRDWFDYATWEEMIYAQLGQGRPVIYSGGGGDGIPGHTFLIDGADGAGFFHFNWGWYGISDGYFSLADLSPVDPGNQSHVYNSAQNMLVDVIPDSGSSLAGNMAIAGKLSSNRSEYNSETDYINVLGGFYSFTLANTQCSIGFMTDTDPPKYFSVIDGELDTAWGYNQVAVFAGVFPEGEYDVYPVFKLPDGEWRNMYYNRAITSGHLHFVNDGVTITVSGAEVPDAVYGDVVSAAFAGVVPRDGVEPRLFPGREYDFVYDVTVDGECVKELMAVLIGEDREIVARGMPVVVDFPSACVSGVSLPLILDGAIGAGNYMVECIERVDGTYRVMSDITWLEVFQERISLDAERLDLFVGDEYALRASTHSELIPVEWTSSDEAVASVDSNGVVKACAEGKATITAVCGGVSAECLVTVSPVLPASIEIRPQYILLEVGKSIVLDVKILPENTTDKTLTWVSSAPERVSVESGGILRAIANGYAEITATCGDVSTICYVSAFSGIGDVEKDAVDVTAARGAVHVFAPEGVMVTVYAVDGTMLYNGLAHDIPLPAGRFYIVVVGEERFKIAVES